MSNGWHASEAEAKVCASLDGGCVHDEEWMASLPWPRVAPDEMMRIVQDAEREGRTLTVREHEQITGERHCGQAVPHPPHTSIVFLAGRSGAQSQRAYLCPGLS